MSTVITDLSEPAIVVIASAMIDASAQRSYPSAVWVSASGGLEPEETTAASSQTDAATYPHR